MSVLLTVTIEGQGVARAADVADPDKARIMSDPRFHYFADRAIRAVLDPRCSSLPLPTEDQGKIQHVTFRFSP
jgi:neural Wiskott-Aldrich syndrome protein